MAHKKFALYFTWLDQIVHEIITNWFTQSFISASLTQLCTSNSPQLIYQRCRVQKNSNYCNFFPIKFWKRVVKKSCLYIGKEKEYSKKIN